MGIPASEALMVLQEHGFRPTEFPGVFTRFFTDRSGVAIDIWRASAEPTQESLRVFLTEYVSQAQIAILNHKGGGYDSIH